MPKQKTHKGLKKRIKITGTGKVKRSRAGHSHLMSCKNSKRRRRLAKATVVVGKQSVTAKRSTNQL